MPLTDLQSTLARLIAVNRSASSHLAGAAALHIEPKSHRISNALDYFHDKELLVGQAFAADRRLLEGAGYHVDVILSQPGFVRAIVGRDNEETKVEWAHDSAWRFLPAIPDPIAGFRLHPIDLAINKVLALAGRDEPRDFLDVIYAHENILTLGSLCWAAVGKDPGYSPEMLVEMLGRKGRYRGADFAPLDLTSQPDLVALKRTWLGAMAEARRLVRELPPEDAGCLYWDPVGGKFVTPAGDPTALVRHFGSMGGVLPSVGDPASIAAYGLPRILMEESPGPSDANPPVSLRKKPGPVRKAP
jgi:hypothetical protein